MLCTHYTSQPDGSLMYRLGVSVHLGFSCWQQRTRSENVQIHNEILFSLYSISSLTSQELIYKSPNSDNILSFEESSKKKKNPKSRKSVLWRVNKCVFVCKDNYSALGWMRSVDDFFVCLFESDREEQVEGTERRSRGRWASDSPDEI